LVSGGFDSLLDHLAIWLGSKGASPTCPSSTSSTTYTMEVDLVALRCLVIDNGRNVLDIKTTGSDIGSEQVGRLSGSE
jgi:hypothetical protein